MGINTRKRTSQSPSKMLYLEDYLEMIEHLPSELRDRFTDMREMDLSVQNQVDRLEERETIFFSDCLKKLKRTEDKELEFAKIKEDYKKAIEDATEKVQVAEECYGLVDRYLRKLDEELHKFKMELEADHRGITEILEKQSLEMDAKNVSHLKENRLPKKLVKKNTFGADKRAINFQPLSNDMMMSLDTPPSLHLPISSFGPGGNAIAQAASQAIAATQQLTGRRTSSLKASFEAVNLGMQSHEFSIGRELAGAAAMAAAASSSSSQASFGADTGFDGPPPPKKKKSKSTEQVLDVVSGGGLLGDSSLLAGMTGDLLSADLRDQDWNFDPNEPRYCICNQVSYGDVVACDNEDCPYEWFHYDCVGITAPPKGKWYCPKCQANMARRKKD